MPFVCRSANQLAPLRSQRHSTDNDVTLRSINDTHDHANLVQLMQSLIAVGRHAGDIFDGIFGEIAALSRRMSNVSDTLERLNTVTAKMHSRKARSCNRPITDFYQVKEPTILCDATPEKAFLFTEATRPRFLQQLCASSRTLPSKLPRATSKHNSSSQTESDGPCGHSTPTPKHQERCAMSTNQTQGVLVAVNTSGQTLRRMSSLRGSFFGLITSPSPTATPVNGFSVCSPKPSITDQKSRRRTIQLGTAMSHATTDTSTKLSGLEEARDVDPYYDLPPFCDNGGKDASSTGVSKPVAISDFNPFASLRRSVRRHRSKHTEQRTQEDFAALDSTSTTSSSTEIKQSNSLKRFIRRSMSLRLPRKRNNQCHSVALAVEDMYVPLRRPAELDLTQKSTYDSTNPRSGRLPISTTSQVMQLALIKREHPSPLMCRTNRGTSSGYAAVQVNGMAAGKKKQSVVPRNQRPESTASVHSNISIDFDKNLSAASYCQGYQLEYPPEACMSDEDAGSSKAIDAEQATAECSPVCASEDSNAESVFSCDQEGYYTSMRQDCGLLSRHHTRPTFSEPPKRGRSFSTHSSSSTVAAYPSSGLYGNIARKMPARSTMPKVALVYPRSYAQATLEAPLLESDIMAKAADVTAISDTCKNIETMEKELDDWLMQKLNQELAMPQKFVVCHTSSLPRKGFAGTTDSVSSASVSPLTGSEKLNGHHTLPRKAVRFCDQI